MLSIFDPTKPATQPLTVGLLDRLDDAVERAKTAGKGQAEVGGALRRLIHSPAVALLVRLSPTPADDAALELLKALFPAA